MTLYYQLFPSRIFYITLKSNKSYPVVDLSGHLIKSKELNDKLQLIFKFYILTDKTETTPVKNIRMKIIKLDG